MWRILESFGWTYLHKASRTGDLQRVQSLLTSGEDANKKDEDGLTALIYATLNGHFEVVKCLLDMGADVNEADQEGQTALFYATSNCNSDIVKLLLERNADVDKACNNGETPLFVAASNGYLELVKLLLEKGCLVDKPGNNGRTPLLAACRDAHLDVIKLLLENDADINVSDNSGYNATQTAMLCKKPEVEKILYIHAKKLMKNPPEGLEAKQIERNKRIEERELEVIKRKKALRSLNEDVEAIRTESKTFQEERSESEKKMVDDIDAKKDERSKLIFKLNSIYGNDNEDGSPKTSEQIEVEEIEASEVLAQIINRNKSISELIKKMKELQDKNEEKGNDMKNRWENLISKRQTEVKEINVIIDEMLDRVRLLTDPEGSWRSSGRDEEVPTSIHDRFHEIQKLRHMIKELTTEVNSIYESVKRNDASSEQPNTSFA